MFVFDVVPVIPCALLCQAWPLCPALLCSGLGLTAWFQLPTARCRSQEPAPGLAAFLPLPRGTEAAVWQPSPAIGACCGLRVGATALGPHREPVLESRCHHSLYWEHPALRHWGVAVESLFMILCYIIGVLFALQIFLITAMLSARMARRRWVLRVRRCLGSVSDC